VEGDVLSDLKLIMKMTDEEIGLRLASRTDKGVNSLGNVAAFNSAIDDPCILLKALNAVSKDIFYISAAIVDEDFNPRFAHIRRYRYILPSKGIDVSLMKRCAEELTGEHDFARFCRPDGKPTTLTLNSVNVREDAGLITIDFEARYYLWNMIRRIVAAMASVGRGDSSVSDITDALNGKDMTFGLARPDALTLMDVCYDGMDFVPSPADAFSARVEEERFRNGLKETFFKSL
jgi:tRNA pseudouridine38-40 synthase